MRSAGRRRRKIRFVDAGALCILIALAAVVAVKVASVMRCARLESALSASAAQALADRDDVAAIVTARGAALATARAAGLDPAVVRATIEPRATSTPAPVHAVMFELLSRSCHAQFEHVLTRALSQRELHSLRHEGIPLRDPR